MALSLLWVDDMCAEWRCGHKRPCSKIVNAKIFAETKAPMQRRLSVDWFRAAQLNEIGDIEADIPLINVCPSVSLFSVYLILLLLPPSTPGCVKGCNYRLSKTGSQILLLSLRVLHTPYFYDRGTSLCVAT